MIRRRQTSAILLVWVVFTAALEAGASRSGQRDPGIQTLKRTLALKPDYATGVLNGSSVLTIVNSSEKPITHVPLILYHMFKIQSAHASDDRQPF